MKTTDINDPVVLVNNVADNLWVGKFRFAKKCRSPLKKICLKAFAESEFGNPGIFVTACLVIKKQSVRGGLTRRSTFRKNSRMSFKKRRNGVRRYVLALAEAPFKKQKIGGTASAYTSQPYLSLFLKSNLRNLRNLREEKRRNDVRLYIPTLFILISKIKSAKSAKSA